MNWKELTEIAQINRIIEESSKAPVLVFKHSTRCSISSAALNRVERAWQDKNGEKVTPYYLDLIAHRDISNQLAASFEVEHQSPQVLLIKDGKCVYNESHMAINLGEILGQVDYL